MHLGQDALAGPPQVGYAGQCCKAVEGVHGTRHSRVMHIGLQRQQDELQVQRKLQGTHITFLII